MAIFDNLINLFKRLREDRNDQFNPAPPFGDYFVDYLETNNKEIVENRG